MNDKIYMKEVKQAAAAIKKWHDEKLGLVPCGLSFNELMKELSK